MVGQSGRSSSMFERLPVVYITRWYGRVFAKNERGRAFASNSVHWRAFGHWSIREGVVGMDVRALVSTWMLASS